MESKLLQYLSTLPAYSDLKKSWQENGGLKNFYIEHFSPPDDFVDEKDDNGCQYFQPANLTEEQRLDQAQFELLNDQSGWFDEFIHEGSMRNDVTEFIRAVLKEIFRCR